MAAPSLSPVSFTCLAEPAKTALTGDPARKADVAALYESIMAISRRQQRKLVREEGEGQWQRLLSAVREPVSAPRVVYQGEPGAYSEEAAMPAGHRWRRSGGGIPPSRS